MKSNAYLRPLLILFLAIVILGAASLIDMEKVSSFGAVKRIDLFAGLRVKPRTTAAAQAGTATASGHRAVDAVAQGPVKETETESRIYDFDDGGSLQGFFEALKRTERTGEKVRIAYFGDSLIEGDLITQDVRAALQKRFGGQGVGFVPITSVASGSRRTITHTFSSDWRALSILRNTGQATPGISGYLFIPRNTQNVIDAPAEELARKPGASWVKYGTSRYEYSTPAFDTVELFYENPAAASTVYYTTASGDSEKRVIEPTDTVAKEILGKCRSQRSVKVSFFPGEQLKVYGMSFESDTGVYVDNFSLRGSSGTNLMNISCKMFSDFNRVRDYKLIVLQYGANIADHTTTKFTWYRNRMVDVVNHIKQCVPGVSIIIVGVNDICSRQEGRLGSAACVEPLVDAQRLVAENTKVGFWNLYEAMGGRDSMAKWVSGKKPLGNPDCTHFNYYGARKVGTMFSEALIAGYDRYKGGHTRR